MELRENMCILIFVLFIVDNTSILKLVFPITYCFSFDSHLSGCVVLIIVVVVPFFRVIVTYLCYHGYHHTVTFVMRDIFHCKC